MREALVWAAQAHPGVVGDMILAADKRIKRRDYGGWHVERGTQRRKKRGRRNR
jgi:hypothetical protein